MAAANSIGNCNEALGSSVKKVEDVENLMDLQSSPFVSKNVPETNAESNRHRNTSGSSSNEFITRNGLKVEKLPTFDHLYISELSHKVLNFQDKMHSEFVRQWRSVVTGDPNK